MAVQKGPGKKIEAPFKWLDQHSNYHNPQDMATRHLWFTLRMIWNHSMPLKFKPYQQYDFAGLYSDEYMEQAVRHITKELQSRSDLDPKWQKELDEMIQYLVRGQLPQKNSKEYLALQ